MVASQLIAELRVPEIGGMMADLQSTSRTGPRVRTLVAVNGIAYKKVGVAVFAACMSVPCVRWSSRQSIKSIVSRGKGCDSTSAEEEVTWSHAKHVAVVVVSCDSRFNTVDGSVLKMDGRFVTESLLTFVPG